MKKYSMILIMFLFFLTGAVAYAETPCLIGWWAVPDAAGYYIYWGTSHGNYPNKVDAGNNLTLAISVPDTGPVYFMATYYDVDRSESQPSEELVVETLSATATVGGSIFPEGNTAHNQGGPQTCVITPNEGYSVADVIVDGVSVGAVPIYEFSQISAKRTISAIFVCGHRPLPPTRLRYLSKLLIRHLRHPA